MKATYLSLVFCVYSCAASAQILSLFTWDGGLPTQADIGPDAVSVSGSAVVAAGGVGGTNGLNSGSPKADLNLTFGATTYFDVPGMAVSFDYQRDEADADALYRGANFSIGAGNRFGVVFQTSDGSGGVTRVASPTYSIADDDVFRTYGFDYDPSTGIAHLNVNGSSIWTYDGPDNRNMVWTGLGNLVIGRLMDASGVDKVSLDNLTISLFGTPALPVTLTTFTAEPERPGTVRLSWSTTAEYTNDYFTVERATHGTPWEPLARVEGQGTSVHHTNYHYVDRHPPAQTVYYRLRQVDVDGSFTYSPVVAVTGAEKFSDGLQVVPNPATRFVTLARSPDSAAPRIFDLRGVEVTSRVATVQGPTSVQLDLGDLPAGAYVIHSDRRAVRVVKL